MEKSTTVQFTYFCQNLFLNDKDEILQLQKALKNFKLLENDEILQTDDYE